MLQAAFPHHHTKEQLAVRGEADMNTRYLIVALFFVAAFSNMNGIALFPFLPTIADELNVSVSVVGQAVTAALVVGAIVGLVAGPLADHYGRRRFVLIGAIIMSISSAGTALATSYEALVLARVAGGLAMGMMGGIGMSIATSRLVGDARRSALGWIGAGAASGAVVGPPFVTFIAELSTWRTGFWILAAAPLLLMAVSYRSIGADVSPGKTGFSILQVVSDYQQILRDRRSVLLQIATLCWCIPWLGGSAYLGSYLIQDHGFSVSGAGYGYMWAAFWFMVGPRVGIRLLRWLDLYPLLFASGLVMAISTIGLFSIGPQMPWLLVFMLVWPLNAGIGMPLINSAVAEAAQTGQSTAMMARQFSWTLGGAIGVAFGGGLIAIGGYALYGVGTGAFAIVVSILVLLAARPHLAPTVEPSGAMSDS
jgi:predicted MFS family arabinose efflux permease